MIKDPERLRAIKSLPQLLAYLRDDLEWPIGTESVDDLTFDYRPDELGLNAEAAVRIKEIKQIRPLAGNQPWGIFWINFEKKRLPVVIMRRILRALVFKKRASANQVERKAWQISDLLFISAYGEDTDRAITLAHFVERQDYGNLAELRVLGWDDDDTPLKYDYIIHTLEDKLHWREDFERDADFWRQTWQAAFTLRHREVITTSKELAMAMAHLARRIRGRVRSVLRYEDGFGGIRKLQRAFQQALIHDLTDDDFADMWAQTITYGLFSAAVSRPAGIHSGNLVDMVPVTNPFLRDMLATFLNLSGRKGRIDFDELGIQEVVDLLNSDDTHLDAVLRDFGNRTRQEDPVIHFYEDFLTQYDKQRKIQRGVFYTPQPVVSYIVRSVHELLQTEFGLEDGLAATVTWGEMLKRNPGLKLPPLTDGTGEQRTIDPSEPFVLILDIATGTATFIIEVIDVIHKTMVAKWKKAGKTDTQIHDLWNDYVPQHLLPRVYGFELMMAPYAIAHMKVGLKLAETGYKFRSNERARIYLTNTLEPKVRQLPAIGFEALAHEAKEVNEVKWYKRFTVVIGNPPYSKISANLSPEARAIIERYRFADGARIKERGALQFEINLQDDYVKFLRSSEVYVEKATTGVLGLITNNGYLSTPTLRGLRDSLLETFSTISLLDLHGHLAKGELGPDGNAEENVFDILQGVAIILGRLNDGRREHASVFHTDLFGSREKKYSYLKEHTLSTMTQSRLSPPPPFYLFVPHDADLEAEWMKSAGLTELFPKNSAGIITARDGLVIAEDKRRLSERMENFSIAKGSEGSVYEEFNFSASKRFDLRKAQEELRKLTSFSTPIRRLLHRPFDSRYIFFDSNVVWSLSRPMADQLVYGRNIALVATRQVTRPQFEHAFVSRYMIEIKACSHDRNTQIFPLFLKHKAYGLNIEAESTPNVSGKLFSNLANTLGLQTVTHCEGHGKDAELTPLKLFDYAYAILYSPAYRKRYFEFLRSDFPRLPLTPRLDLFRALAALGGDLVALHLLESPQLDHLITKFIGDPKQEIEKIAFTVGRVSDAAPSVEATSRRFSVTGRDAASTTAAPATGTVWIDKTQTTGFQGVPDNVWNFHIGGYQVCEKWLKDRKGRTLSKDDMAHYQKIVVALTETIRLMSEIDKVIEAHGGWPGAFASTTAQSEREKPADLPMAAEGRASYSTVRAEDSGTMRNRDEAD